MDRTDKDILLARIASGITLFIENETKYFIHPPTRLLKQMAFQYYQSIIESTLFEDWLSEEEIQSFLLSEGILPKNADEEITTTEKRIEDIKLRAYENRIDKTTVKALKTQIRQLQHRLGLLFSAKHSLDYLTREGYADSCRLNYLIGKCIRDEDNNIVNIDDDGLLLDRILTHIAKQQISPTRFREISRTDPWRSIWNSGGENPFGGASIDLTDDQKTIILYSKMYDNAYKHPECPDDNIINDDDLFDGWMIFQRKKAEREKKEQNKKELKDGDNFIVPQGKTEAQRQAHRREIDKMNDIQARKIRQQRDEFLKQKGKVKESQLPDVQQELRMQATQLAKSKAKGT